MKVGPIHPVSPTSRNQDALKKKDGVTKDRTQPQVDRFEPAPDKKVKTYGKVIGKADQVTIDKIRAESEKTYESLRRLVEQLLERQGSTMEKISHRDIVVDEEVRIEASALIADDGPLGAENMSNRIVDFAKAISGGDKSKIGAIREAIEEGFSQVSAVFDGLPDVSQRTYDLVMEKLAAWENGA
ncbi:MAG: hypothetical protein NUK65_00070 [Firmicutes bacterium]|nr:hypothetical protein [Bacillota bacterium]